MLNNELNNSNSFTSLFDLVKSLPKNKTIRSSMVKAWSHINNPLYETAVCAISGGSDSDVMLDICTKCDKDNKIQYTWLNTGLEYEATKDHLSYLEEKYGIEIHRCKPIKSIPASCREYGVPFLSKMVSEYIYRLQRHNFQFENDTYENLIQKYPKCQSALKWWCGEKGEGSHFNIQQNKWLKEFMVLNPPDFKISAKCCSYAKKEPVKKLYKETGCDLSIVGVRKAEGGSRAAAYKSCFDDNGSEMSNYRPLFWYTNSDKKDYEEAFNIKHSDCYEVYGLSRTGCVGCPFGRDLDKELEVIRTYEPKFYDAVINIFGKSYEYTEQYKEFCKQMDEKYGNYKKYLNEVKKYG